MMMTSAAAIFRAEHPVAAIDSAAFQIAAFSHHSIERRLHAALCLRETAIPPNTNLPVEVGSDGAAGLDGGSSSRRRQRLVCADRISEIKFRIKKITNIFIRRDFFIRVGVCAW